MAPYGYAHCPHCKGISMDRDLLLSPQVEIDRYRQHNNDVEDPRYRNFVRPLVNLIVSNHTPPEKGLDFGAGPGPVITRMLNDRGFQVALYDPFFHPDMRVLQDRYDFIVSCEVIEHFYDPRASFELLKSLLGPNGVLYCRTTLVSDDTDFPRWHYRHEDTHVFFYHEKTIAWIADTIMCCDYTILDRNVLYFSTRQQQQT